MTYIPADMRDVLCAVYCVEKGRGDGTGAVLSRIPYFVSKCAADAGRHLLRSVLASGSFREDRAAAPPALDPVVHALREESDSDRVGLERNAMFARGITKGTWL